MRIVSTASHLSSAFKNASRVREILSVFVEHGFADLVHRMTLSRFLPLRLKRREAYQDLSFPVRLRMAFEELGPTFVKLGQLLSTRSDLVPEAICEEFKKLQDQVASVPFSTTRSFLEQEWATQISAIFSEFEDVPMAAASIAQVHGGVLLTGEKVAVKIQRPDVERQIQADIAILRGMAELMERYVPESRPFNPTGLVEEFFRSIVQELDFHVEANNMRRIRGNLSEVKAVVVPKVFTQWSNRRVLVMERLSGVRFSNREAILKKGFSPKDIAEAGSDAFFSMVMRDGLFHGDLHAGNILVLDDGRIGLLDFGIVGRLSRRVQDGIITMFLSIIDEDYETLASEYVFLCKPAGRIQISEFQKDLMDAVSPYVGMSLGSVNVGQLLLRSTSIAVRHKLRVPRELMLLFKALLTIESLGRDLEPDFDILKIGHKLARQLITTRYSKDRLLREVLVLGRDAFELAESFPRQMRLFLRRWSEQDFALTIQNRDTARLARAVTRFERTLAVLTTSVFVFILGAIVLFVPTLPGPLHDVLGAYSHWRAALGFILIVFAVMLSGTRSWNQFRGQDDV